MILAKLSFLPLVPLLPLASFTLLILLGRRLGKLSAGVSLLALMGSLAASIHTMVFGFRFSAMVPPQVHYVWQWFWIGEKPMTFGLLADPLSILMCLVVTGVGWLIMLYSIGYMGADPRFSRFFAYLSLFCSAMLLLVLADNLLLLYIGWELVGLCSYLLISFWFEKTSAADAGKKAFLTTRVGDLGLLGAILLMAWVSGDLGLTDMQAKAAALGKWAPIIGLLIFWGAAGKSAQIPLHVWLPDAMEGPTPVSALIHAATMVAAGVYLVARALPLFSHSPDAMLIIAAVGGATSFFAATVACTQTDLKRILAYSTISQLGFMMLALGCGSAFAGMFHLLTHAWFKALLFLGAGSVIHAVHHQEVTRMGGLWRSMPVTALTFTLAAVAMAGIPPFSGFWSKEEIFLTVVGFKHPDFPYAGRFFLGLALLIASLTAFYITRAVLLTFAGAPRAPHQEHVHESPFVMIGPLLLLSLGAIGIGTLGAPGTDHWLQHFLGAEIHGISHQASAYSTDLTTDLWHKWIQTVSFMAAVAGIMLAFFRYSLGIHLFPRILRMYLYPLYRLVYRKYFIDELYHLIFIRPFFRLTRDARFVDVKVIDALVNLVGAFGLWLSRVKGWIDRVIVDGAVNGIGMTFNRTGSALRLIQTGLVQNYLLIALSGAITIFLILRWIL